jgi:monoamine oxidase
MADAARLDADVLVVGAGLAGLTAARRLEQAGHDALVVEARDRVGGRTLSLPVPGADPDDPAAVLDLGAGWVGPTQDRVLALIGELGLATFPTYEAGDNLSEHKGTLRRYRGTIPRLGALALADIAQAQLRLDRMARTVPVETPWAAPRAAVWDRTTFAGWIRRNLRTGTGRDLMQIVAEAVWAAHPAELSFLHVLFYLRAAGGFDALTGVRGGAQQDRVVGGTQRIALAAAAALRREPVLDAPVQAVDWTADRVTLTLRDGRRVTGRRSVLALAPHLLAPVRFEPTLPPLRHQLHQRMPPGTVIKCHAVYPTPFWRDAGLSGQAADPTGPVKVTFDASPPGGSPGVLLGFVEGRQARQLGAGSARERRQAVLDCLVRYFGPAAGRPTGFVERAWATDPYAGGCYAGYFGPNGWTDYGGVLRPPIGPLHFAGTETATAWFGYLDGAVRSGEAAAAAVGAELAAAQPGR